MVTSEYERLVYIRPDGIRYELHAPPTRIVLSEEGFGLPPIDYITERGPLQHGVTVRDYFLQPRPIQLTILQTFQDRSKYWDGRATLLDTLRPNRITDFAAPGKLLKYRSNGTKRQIDVMLVSGPGFQPPQGGWRGFQFTEVIRFTAFNPVSYDPTIQTRSFSSVGASQLQFPITFPIQFSSFGFSENIPYIGTWLEYPSFTITGPITGLIIRNLTTDESIGLNYAIPAGLSVTISLMYGSKIATQSDGIDLRGYITEDSDLATFHLAADPEAPNGVNEISIYGSGTSGATAVTMNWYTREIGF